MWYIKNNIKDSCREGNFVCKSGKIICKEKACDSIQDCPDGSDENNCGILFNYRK